MNTAFEHRGTVGWRETDASGKFHYSAAMIWAEDAEHALCRSLDPRYSPGNKPRRAVSATYNAPFMAGDAFRVRLWVAKMGKSSVTFEWTILNRDVVAVEGSHTVINLGADHRPAPWPDTLAAPLAAYLKGTDDE